MILLFVKMPWEGNFRNKTPANLLKSYWRLKLWSNENNWTQQPIFQDRSRFITTVVSRQFWSFCHLFKTYKINFRGSAPVGICYSFGELKKGLRTFFMSLARIGIIWNQVTTHYLTTAGHSKEHFFLSK